MHMNIVIVQPTGLACIENIKAFVAGDPINLV
jgi:hypothetical protein